MAHTQLLKLKLCNGEGKLTVHTWRVSETKEGQDESVKPLREDGGGGRGGSTENQLKEGEKSSKDKKT